MRSFIVLLPAAAILLAGCTQTADESTAGGTAVSDAPASDMGMPDSGLGTEVTMSSGSAAADGPSIALTPANTKIEFIGTHVVEEKPDPMARRGHFADFSGTAAVEGDVLKSVSLVINTESVTTEQDRLTNHLKSADFFDVAEHPEASFTSKSVVAGDGDGVTITGDLTLLGTTNEVSVPATVSTTDGLTLTAEFTIDRTTFGMDYDPTKVEKDVTLMISIGK